jgi:choline dehydrogenase-like flavoprotein
MGKPESPTSVVDLEIRVLGIKALRICDASIMPQIPIGNIHAPTGMTRSGVLSSSKNTGKALKRLASVNIL